MLGGEGDLRRVVKAQDRGVRVGGLDAHTQRVTSMRKPGEKKRRKSFFSVPKNQQETKRLKTEISGHLPMPDGFPCARALSSESWYGNAKVLTSDSTWCFVFSLSGALFEPYDTSYSGANAVRMFIARSATGTPLLRLRMYSTRAMFERKRFAPGCSGFAINWNEKNIAAEKQWNGAQCTCTGTAGCVFPITSGRVWLASWMSFAAPLAAVSSDWDMYSCMLSWLVGSRRPPSPFAPPPVGVLVPPPSSVEA